MSKRTREEIEKELRMYEANELGGKLNEVDTIKIELLMDIREVLCDLLEHEYSK